MSELKFSLEEELPSPELFSDPEVDTNVSIAGTTENASSSSTGRVEPDISSDDVEWKGISLDEIYKHRGPFDWNHLPPIHPSPNHTVLFELPLNNRGPPKPYPTVQADKWNQNYVRMPHSVHSLYPINPENEASGGFRRRWEVIQEALLQNFISSQQLQTAILSYNHKYAERWNFSALHHFFDKYIDEDETRLCLSSLVPKMVQLALQLPELITGAMPLLKRETNASISLSQLQVASLLANAFFCTFPRRNSSNPDSEYGGFPYINFNRLFSSWSQKKNVRTSAVLEKLKCIFHYFRRVTTKFPEGTITIQRKYIAKRNCPRWDEQEARLPSLHITSKGTIESHGTGLLQVDFANKYIGGGVLNFGCVQEEIRFVVCPELLVTMLVTEALENTEALIVKGIERYSRYKGYSNSFTWDGDFIDETPRDSSGRMKTCIVAIDALQFNQSVTQYHMRNVIRELNKAYVGFSSDLATNDLPAVATGNWGCGAFRGNPELKVLVQLMAAGVAGRSVVYYTFGDISLRDKLAEMYWHLVRQDVDIGRLFKLISAYQDVAPKMRSDFYPFLHNRTKMKTTNFFKSDETDTPSTSKEEIYSTKTQKWDFNVNFKKHATMAKKEDDLEDKIGKWLQSVENDAEEASTSAEGSCSKAQVQTKMLVEESSSENSSTIPEIVEKITEQSSYNKKQTFDQIFGERAPLYESPRKKVSALDRLDKLLIEESTNEISEKNVSMDVDSKIESKEKTEEKTGIDKSNNCNQKNDQKKDFQRKISDYFKKSET